MSNKVFTLIEVVVYVFVVSFLGFFVFLLLDNFIYSIENNKNVTSFSKSYNNFINYSYSNLYKNWQFKENNNNNVILYNSGNIIGYSGYIGYNCYSTGIGITYISSSLTGINWNDFQKKFTGVNCINLSGRKKGNNSYWLDIKINIKKRGMELNLLFDK